jgi:hypothetical protein
VLELFLSFIMSHQRCFSRYHQSIVIYKCLWRCWVHFLHSLQKLELVNGVLFTGGSAKDGLYFETVGTIFKVSIYYLKSISNKSI